ncbi:MAG: NAD-dependent epimerase/dehydratase family protein [Nocardiopsaceae bacterium]|nr:NAD-dependent epimerase/dehydratase family protein [Nocardiopsaceae bacterium]
MRILILGGTRFVGYTLLERAIRAGWEATSFSRGMSGLPPADVRVVQGDRLNKRDLERLAVAGPWDAVVDTSGFVPRDVLMACEYLRPATAHYVFVSTVSVYRGWPKEPLSESSEVLYCPIDAGPDYGEDVEDGPTKYGYQKSGCELAATSSFGLERCTILRPGVILGPREYIGRLPWWLRRTALGGHVLAPGNPARFIQPIDVRDLADFTLLAISQPLAGTYNITAPQNRDTFGQMLQACVEVTGSAAKLAWIPDEKLVAAGVRQWSQLPLWRTSRGVWQVDSTKAQGYGLSSRRIQDTVADTWEWMKSEEMLLTDQRSAEIGINPDLERWILNQLTGK